MVLWDGFSKAEKASLLVSFSSLIFFSFYMRTAAVFSVSWLYRMCPVRSSVKHAVATTEDAASPEQSEKISVSALICVCPYPYSKAGTSDAGRRY